MRRPLPPRPQRFLDQCPLPGQVWGSRPGSAPLSSTLPESEAVRCAVQECVVKSWDPDYYQSKIGGGYQ